MRVLPRDYPQPLKLCHAVNIIIKLSGISFFCDILQMAYSVFAEGSFVIPTGFAVLLLIIRWWRILDRWPALPSIFHTKTSTVNQSEG